MMRNNINFFCDMGKSSYISDIAKEQFKNEGSVKPLITLITKRKRKVPSLTIDLCPNGDYRLNYKKQKST